MLKFPTCSIFHKYITIYLDLIYSFKIFYTTISKNYNQTTKNRFCFKTKKLKKHTSPHVWIWIMFQYLLVKVEFPTCIFYKYITKDLDLIYLWLICYITIAKIIIKLQENKNNLIIKNRKN